VTDHPESPSPESPSPESLSPESPSPEKREELTPLQQSVLVIKKLKARVAALEREKTEPIAILGVGCRFPGGADDPEAYWRLLRDGVDAIREVPAERWDVDAYYDPDPAAPGKMSTRNGGFLDRVDRFDAGFFGISPREATSLDPQQRLLLEVAWEALERAGQAPDRLAADRTGAFVGIGQMDYAQLLLAHADPRRIDVHAATGNGFCFASGRLSYALGLRGPNMAIDTACSSSLVSVHMACQSLRARECDLALAGGVQLMLSPQPFVGLTKLGALSPDGRCKTFDAAADGYGRGEGCGIIVCKRLSDALADGDPILAVIRGSAINHDGASSGFTVPNGLAQQELLRRALDHARVKPAEVGYVETHGTGTELGDPIDVEALAAVFSAQRPPARPLRIGSVKTNVGHLEAAAGIAGLVKVVLSLGHREIPPHLHLETPNPHVPWSEIPIEVPTAPTPWNSEAGPRIAGVSSFGLSGSNAHVVLEEAPPPAPRPQAVDRPSHLLPLSTRSGAALAELARRHRSYLEAHPETPPGDFCFTLAAGRAHFPCRAAVVADSAAQLLAGLAAVAEEEREPAERGAQRPRIAFLFTGQGSQNVGMGRSLYRTQPTFRAALDRCDELLRPHLERPLLEVLHPDDDDSPLHDTAYTQPALFAIEYALAELWRSWGIEPATMMGHSVGEYVAACLAGVFSLEDGLKLIARRARLMQELPRDGSMAVVLAPAAQVSEVIGAWPEELSIAAFNGPQNTVISGRSEAVEKALATFEGRGVRIQRLKVSHAFHSPLMEPMLEELAEVAREVRYHPPRRSLVSNHEGRPATAEIATADYWVSHVRRPVRFADGMATLAQQGITLFLEVGPKPALLAMGRRCLPEGSAQWLPSLRPGQEEWQSMLRSLAELYRHGARVDWAGFDRDYPRRRLTLPTYPFERQSYWPELGGLRRPGALPGPDAADAHPFLGTRLRLPFSGETRFETRFTLASPAYLEDHRLFDTVVVPGASHLAMVLGAVQESYRPAACVLEELFFPQALVLDEESLATVQTILTPEGSGLAFRVVSLPEHGDPDDPAAWVLHFTGKVRPIATELGLTAPETVDLQSLRERCDHELPAAEFYANFKRARYDLGPSFQWLGTIWQGRGEALARVERPALPDRLDAYQLYPGLVDSCFQLLAGCWRGETTDAGRDDIYVPFTIASFHSYPGGGDGGNGGVGDADADGNGDGGLWCHTRIRPEELAAGEGLVADTRLFDGSGRVIAEIRGFEGRKASRRVLLQSLRKNLDDWLYELAWPAVPRPAVPRPAPELPAAPEPASAGEPGSWLIFSDPGELGPRLATLFEELGDPCLRVESGERFERRDRNLYRLDPSRPEDFRRLLAEALPGDAPCRGVVHLWSLAEPPLPAAGADGEPGADAGVDSAQLLGCASVLHLVQAVADAGWATPPRLWLVTRNAVPVAADAAPLAVEQAPLWGLGRVLALEHPELSCVRVDLDPEASPGDDEARALFEEVTHPGPEDQLALRGGTRHAARLARFAAGSRGARDGAGLPSGPYRVTTDTFGILETLRLRPMTRRPPEPGEVEVRVRATGLNLRDVLLALGMFGEALEQLGVRNAAEVPFGFECAGEIVAVGDGVTAFAPGDEVMGLALAGMNSLVTVDPALLVAKPRGWSFEEAATAPLAFMTAHFGLHHLARTKPGDRVLIHAAAGGVGQAAVQLAQRAGAEIFATASAPKWDFLKAQGVERIASSRTLDFADEIRAATGGRGVDVVLNSLNADFIPKSLELLADGGRFVELGKIGIWDPEQVRELRPDVRYFNFDLATTSLESPELIASLFAELAAGFEDRTLRPLPHRVFPILEVAEAFRFMAQAKHLGKVVLHHPEREEAAPPRGPMIRDDASYLVTGGLGALGLQLAEWMVAEGARHLVLAGRGEPSAAARRTIGQMEEAGARVAVVRGDVADRADVARMLAPEADGRPPLRGIVHAAGVLDDGTLLTQDWQRFRRVLAPKLDGAWWLHTVSRELELELDFFVGYSSMASLLGSPGQGSYAAANAFLDALAHHRRALGLPATSIDWGAWADAGMAARLDDRTKTRWSEQGLGTIPPRSGLDLLEQLWTRDATQVGVMPVSWSRFLKQFPPGLLPPLLEAFAHEARSALPTKSRFIETLEKTPADERHALLMDEVRSQIARVLGVASYEEIEPRDRLFDLGLDSLMAIELKTRLEATLCCQMLPTLVFDYPTVEALVGYFAQEPLAAHFAPEGGPGPEVEPPPEPAEELAELSQEEVADLLVRELAEIEEDNAP